MGAFTLMSPSLVVAYVLVPALGFALLADQRFRPAATKTLLAHTVMGFAVAAPLTVFAVDFAASHATGVMHGFTILTLGQLGVGYQLLAALWVMRVALGAMPFRR
jgi:mannose/fructose/N-acetylgalactosamine-specific phosphotransferase system component IIC